MDDRQRENALVIFTSSVASASHSGSVVERSHKCSLFSITFRKFLIKLVQRKKANVKTGFFNQRIATLGLFMQPMNVDDFLLEPGAVVDDPLI
jgi:hypothetical protein